MRLTFQLRFYTHPGQSLLLSGDHEFFGSGQVERALTLHYLNSETWQATVLIPQTVLPDQPICYQYLLRNSDGSLVRDWGNDRVLNLARWTADELLVVDSWNHAGFFENAFYTEPFQDVLLAQDLTQVTVPRPARPTHFFNIKAPLLTRGQTLCLLGNVSELGNWNTSAPVLLNRTPGQPFLTAALDLSAASFPLYYKYAVYDWSNKSFVRYEDGPNRVLYDTLAPHKQTIVHDGFVRLPVTGWKGAGVALPVFSLRSEHSFGVGEFSDLRPFADWCRQVGLKLLQILPVNDTSATLTWTDSYPYAAISAFALHPIYLNLSEVTGHRHQRVLRDLEPERLRLNALPEVDYEAVLRIKLDFLKRIYPHERARTFKSRAYRAFFEQNQDWLVPYALFCYFRDQYGTADFNRWAAHRIYSEADAASLTSDNSPVWEDIAFSYFVQFHLHQQFQAATQYAHQRGVVIKGDIAIGVDRYGVDAWQHRELFHLDVQAGAPPDPFAARGQNWGFPTYNWPRMEADGFAWWRRRFEQLSRYTDAFRIDHILGFFRIWSIPAHAVEGILGLFVPALPVYLSEFAARGFVFERQRYLNPYITEAVLAELFGPVRDLAKSRFLNSDRFGNFALKPEFATQRQVESHFASLPPSDENRHLEQGLFELISNVLLFEVPDSQGQQYHFRFGMEDTSSFRALDLQTQVRLKDLYLDYFFRRQESLWMQEGLRKLPALKRATNLLVCGEDLGLVPACVPEAMKQLGVLGLEVQRMPKRLGQEFSRPKDAPYLSVVTPSTHDMSTIRGWWTEATSTQKFYNQELDLPGTAPTDCPGWLNELIVRQHLASPAMWSIFQLQDLLGMDETLRRPDPGAERINVPANPKHYWRYRLHLSLEQLLRATSFNEYLRSLLQQNGR